MPHIIKKIKILKILTANCLLIALLPCHILANTWLLNSMVVFGSGSSDNGNSFATYGIPYCSDKSKCTEPYWHRRFSNGPIWAEYLAWRLRLITNPLNNPHYNKKKSFLDYAIFGATTKAEYDINMKDSYNITIRDEIKTYKNRKHPFAGNTLAIIFTENDIASYACLKESLRCLENIVTEDIANITELYKIGVRHFIVITPGKLDNTPYITNTQSKQYQDALKATELNYATQFAFIKTNINKKFPDASVLIFNLYRFNVDTQPKYRQPLQVPCYNNLQNNKLIYTKQINKVCSPTEALNYYFYDNIFYSTVINRKMADSIYISINQNTNWLKKPTHRWWNRIF